MNDENYEKFIVLLNKEAELYDNDDSDNDDNDYGEARAVGLRFALHWAKTYQIASQLANNQNTSELLHSDD